MNRFSVILVSFSLAFLWVGSTKADIVLRPIPLPTVIHQSEVIATARIKSYQQIVAKTPLSTLSAVSRLRGPGTYTFEILHVIKGRSENILKAHLPEVNSWSYNLTPVNVNVGDTVLIFIKRNTKDSLIAVDPTLPFIKLHQTSKNVKADNLASTESAVLDVVLQSFFDPVLRRANLYILRTMVHPRMKSSIAKYADDPDLWTRDAALYGLAINQEVSVIPKISKVAIKILEQGEGEGAESVSALEKFTTPKAVPYLNKLLFSPATDVRLMTMFALDNLADRSSIPYLMLALKDPDIVVAGKAYFILHQLLPALSPAKLNPYFEDNREEATCVLYAWWADEMAGKHIATPAKGNSTPQPGRSQGQAGKRVSTSSPLPN